MYSCELWLFLFLWLSLDLDYLRQLFSGLIAPLSRKAAARTWCGHILVCKQRVGLSIYALGALFLDVRVSAWTPGWLEHPLLI